MPLGTLSSKPQGRGQCQVTAGPPTEAARGTSCHRAGQLGRSSVEMDGVAFLPSSLIAHPSSPQGAEYSFFLPSSPAPLHNPGCIIMCEERLTPKHGIRPSITLPCGCAAHPGPSSRLAGVAQPRASIFQVNPASITGCQRRSLLQGSRCSGKTLGRCWPFSPPHQRAQGPRVSGAHASLSPHFAGGLTGAQSRSLIFSGVKASMFTSFINSFVKHLQHLLSTASGYMRMTRRSP